MTDPRGGWNSSSRAGDDRAISELPPEVGSAGQSVEEAFGERLLLVTSSDFERQRLLRFVTQLACADTPAVEAQRAAFIKAQKATAYSFEHGLRVLERALAIGRQADAMPAAEVRGRMEDVQSRPWDSPIFAKVKSWFDRNKQTEPAA